MQPRRAWTASTPIFGRVTSGMDVVQEAEARRHAQEGFREVVSVGCSGQQLHHPLQLRIPLDELRPGTRRPAPVRAALSGSRRWPPISPRNGCWRRDTPSSPRATAALAASANGCSSSARVQVVVAILRRLVLPPLRGVAAVQPQIVEAPDVRQQRLPDRGLELRLVDLRQRRLVCSLSRSAVSDGCRRSSCDAAARRRPGSRETPSAATRGSRATPDRS